jgi:hypothetical protein
MTHQTREIGSLSLFGQRMAQQKSFGRQFQAIEDELSNSRSDPERFCRSGAQALFVIFVIFWCAKKARWF